MAIFEIFTKDESGLYDYAYGGDTFKAAVKAMENSGDKERACSVRLHGQEIFTGTVFVKSSDVKFVLEA